MRFIQTAGWDRGTHDLTTRLVTELEKDKRVLWLVPGGSNITASTKVMAALPEANTAKLTIFLTDERYGEVGHPDSNTRQLDDAGFNPQRATFVPALASGLSLAETQESYGQAIARAFKQADIIIGQFGIGADGHIAGILPQSPAVSAQSWVVGYEAPPFRRLTLTFTALRHVTAAYAMAFGAEKKAALEQLRSQPRSLADQPSQILKELPEAYVYNDQIGDKA